MAIYYVSNYENIVCNITFFSSFFFYKKNVCNTTSLEKGSFFFFFPYFLFIINCDWFAGKSIFYITRRDPSAQQFHLCVSDHADCL